jgi:cytochrome c oxidase cbb3-type subunit III
MVGEFILRLTIIFAFVYLVRFHVIQRLHIKPRKNMKQKWLLAEEAHAKYLLTAPDLVNVDNVELLTDAASIAEGKKVYEANNCISCHGQNLEGGIGPNLVDANWINGGGVKKVLEIPLVPLTKKAKEPLFFPKNRKDLFMINEN